MLPVNVTPVIPPGMYLPAVGPPGVVQAPSIKPPFGFPAVQSSAFAGSRGWSSRSLDQSDSGLLQTYAPGQGSTGVVPPAQAPNLVRQDVPASPYEGSRGNLPVTPPGRGFASGLRQEIANMDVVNGMDRTLGKTTTIPQGRKMAERSKNWGAMTTQQALGPLSGATFIRSYTGRILDQIV